MANAAVSAAKADCDRLIVALVASVSVIEVSLLSESKAVRPACTFAAVSETVKLTVAFTGAADCRAAACATVAPVTTRL